ncbi:MAG: S8 family serine peptidase [Minisyncoccia bacterium]
MADIDRIAALLQRLSELRQLLLERTKTIPIVQNSADISGSIQTNSTTKSNSSQNLSNVESTEKNDPKAEFVPGEVVIKFKSKTTADLIEKALSGSNRNEVFLSRFLSRLGARDTNLQIKVKEIDSIFEHLENQLKSGNKTEISLDQQIERRFSQRARRSAEPTKLFKPTNLHKIIFDKSVKVEDILSQLNKSPEVEYAEPNFIYRGLVVPNDPYYFSQGSWGQNYGDLWGLKKIQAENAWNITEGAGKTVAVIDTGLDYNHDDIKNNVWLNTREIANNGVDDDGNGFVDDVNGWDFTTCEIFVFDCTRPKTEDNNPMDGDGHGTHVSGAIAASGNNGLGIIGVAPKAKIMALKGLNDQGAGNSTDLAAAIRYAADNGADVINMSWGGVGNSKVIEDAIKYASSLGVVLVAAAGNSNEDVSPGFYPANYGEVIAIASSDENDRRSSFSNYGAKVLVAAPGGGSTDSSTNKTYRNILSLRSGVTDMYGDGINVVGTNYYRSRGTSMASPHAAGLAALILSSEPAFTKDQVTQVMQASADDIESPGPDLLTGSGRINVSKALNIKSTPNVSITNPVDGSVLVRSANLVNIQGTASGAGFSSYQLSYWSESLSYWIPIGGAVATPVENGFLGSWNIKDLTVGPHLLQLAVTDNKGQIFSKIIKVEIENYFPEPISISPGYQIKPKISGDLIIWSDLPNFGTPEALFVHDLANKTETQLTDRSLAAQTPDISGNRIVWRSYPGSSDIYLCTYNRITKQCLVEQITSDSASQAEPVIDGNRIVWQDNRNGNWDIYLRDLSTNTTERITFDLNNQTNPDIFGNLITWEEWGSNPGSDVYLYDLSKRTSLRITTDSGWQGNPAVSGNRVVWEDGRSGSPDIYTCVYNTETSQCPEEKLLADNSFRTNPDISDSKIVWRDIKNGNENIYLYDISKPLVGVEAITANKSVQELPAIDKDRVVWEDSRNNSPPFAFWDIYMAQLGTSGSATTTPPLPAPAPAPKPVPVPDKIFDFIFPAGGESLEIGKTYDVKWQTASTTADLSTVRLSLYKDEVPKDFIAIDIPNDGLYSWTVPALAVGSRYKLRVFNPSYPNNFTDSGVFSVASSTNTVPTPSPVPVPQPSPTEPGSSKADLVIYEFSVSPKKENYSKADSFLLSYTVKNIGTKESGPFQVSAINKTNGREMGVLGWSNLLPGGLAVNAGTSWEKLGNVSSEGYNLVEIKVDSSGLVDESNENNNLTTFGVAVLADGASTATSTPPSAPAPAPSNPTPVPTPTPPPSTSTTTPSIPSPAPVASRFSITTPPNLAVGSSYNITWQTTQGNSATIRLSLYQNGGFKDFIVADTANDGNHTWTVPNSIGSAYSIRVFDLAYPNNYTDSGQFSITASSASATTAVLASILDSARVMINQLAEEIKNLRR